MSTPRMTGGGPSRPRREQSDEVQQTSKSKPKKRKVKTRGASKPTTVGSITTPYLAVAPLPTSSRSTLQNIPTQIASTSSLVLPSTYIRTKSQSNIHVIHSTRTGGTAERSSHRTTRGGGGFGAGLLAPPSVMPNGGSRVDVLNTNFETRRRGYAANLVAPPSVMPGGISATPRIQGSGSNSPRRRERREAREAREGQLREGREGRDGREQGLNEINTNNQSSASLGRIPENTSIQDTGQNGVDGVDASPASTRTGRRRIVTGDGDGGGVSRRLTVSSREEGRAIGLARGASMRRRNVWDDLPESSDPPPPFPFPTSANNRQPPTFTPQTIPIPEIIEPQDTAAIPISIPQRPWSPPPSFEQAIASISSPAPATELGQEAGTPLASRRLSGVSAVSDNASTIAPSVYASAVGTPENSDSETEGGQGSGTEEEDDKDRVMWKRDIEAGYSLEDRVKREMERRQSKVNELKVADEGTEDSEEEVPPATEGGNPSLVGQAVSSEHSLSEEASLPPTIIQETSRIESMDFTEPVMPSKDSGEESGDFSEKTPDQGRKQEVVETPNRPQESETLAIAAPSPISPKRPRKVSRLSGEVGAITPRLIRQKTPVTPIPIIPDTTTPRPSMARRKTSELEVGSVKMTSLKLDSQKLSDDLPQNVEAVHKSSGSPKMGETGSSLGNEPSKKVDAIMLVEESRQEKISSSLDGNIGQSEQLAKLASPPIEAPRSIDPAPSTPPSAQTKTPPPAAAQGDQIISGPSRKLTRGKAIRRQSSGLNDGASINSKRRSISGESPKRPLFEESDYKWIPASSFPNQFSEEPRSEEITGQRDGETKAVGAVLDQTKSLSNLASTPNLRSFRVPESVFPSNGIKLGRPISVGEPSPTESRNNIQEDGLLPHREAAMKRRELLVPQYDVFTASPSAANGPNVNQSLNKAEQVTPSSIHQRFASSTDDEKISESSSQAIARMEQEQSLRMIREETASAVDLEIRSPRKRRTPPPPPLKKTLVSATGGANLVPRRSIIRTADTPVTPRPNRQLSITEADHTPLHMRRPPPPIPQKEELPLLRPLNVRHLTEQSTGNSSTSEQATPTSPFSPRLQRLPNRIRPRGPRPIPPPRPWGKFALPEKDSKLPLRPLNDRTRSDTVLSQSSLTIRTPPRSTSEMDTRNGEGSSSRSPVEYTDLDVLISRLEGSGREYEGFTQITNFLGPGKSLAATPEALNTLLPGLIFVDSRRVTQQGKVKLKLSLFGVRVVKCPICLAQFKKDERAVLLPMCGHVSHEECARTWFREDSRCMVCREPLLHEEAEGSETQEHRRFGEGVV